MKTVQYHDYDGRLKRKKVYSVSEFSEVLPKKINSRNIGKYGQKHRYLKLHCGFDIETTNYNAGSTENPDFYAYMYIWQFSINSRVIMGRTWVEFVELIDKLCELCENDDGENRRIIVWVANLSFEFQFLRKHVQITDVFAREARQPIYCVIADCIEMRDCLQISGGNLASLAKDYCTTQKLIGDLDYSLPRHSNTTLYENELAYCINDVVILSEFSEFIWKNYVYTENYIPLTKTGILRKAVKDNAKRKAKENNVSIREIMHRLYPKTKESYDIAMRYLFRGGYVHSNILHTGRILKGVWGADETSAYPAMMNQKYFPVSEFTAAAPTVENVEKCVDEFCCIICATFENLTATTTHTIESRSKVYSISGNVTEDNGRIMQADSVTVFLTELDYKAYKLFYKWDNIIIHSLKLSARGKLPVYLIEELNKNYIAKSKLKREGKDDTIQYVISKQMVNSAYGLTVARLNLLDHRYINDEWQPPTPTEKTYEEIVDSQVLSPYWGIWVTAHARYAIYTMINIIGSDVVYCDTDSVYFINGEKHLPKLTAYNNNIMKQNAEIFGDNEIFADLGCFDDLPKCKRFKTLGAKRYLKEYYSKKKGKNVIEQTIAGLPKKALIQHCEKNNLNPFVYFRDDMVLDRVASDKRTTCYNDEPHRHVIKDYNGDCMAMSELSSVAIYDIPFTLNMSNVYTDLIKFITNSMKGRYFND